MTSDEGLNISESVRKLRREYSHASLSEVETHSDPFRQFDTWFQDALRAEIVEPNAMCLSTCGRGQRPNSRMVLLKGIEERALLFFTNYRSAKGIEIAENPLVSLLFYWPEIERQIRIQGRAERLSRERSAEYFAGRPRDSQLGAHASKQSSIVKDREQLELIYQRKKEEFEGREVPCPSYWGGYGVVPDLFEFWQGRANRLHDRLSYRLEEGGWKIARLSP